MKDELVQDERSSEIEGNPGNCWIMGGREGKGVRISFQEGGSGQLA